MFPCSPKPLGDPQNYDLYNKMKEKHRVKQKNREVDKSRAVNINDVSLIFSFVMARTIMASATVNQMWTLGTAVSVEMGIMICRILIATVVKVRLSTII